MTTWSLALTKSPLPRLTRFACATRSGSRYRIFAIGQKRTLGDDVGDRRNNVQRLLVVDLPAGLTVNPQSTTRQCKLKPGESPAECATTAPGSKVGTSGDRRRTPPPASRSPCPKPTSTTWSRRWRTRPLRPQPPRQRSLPRSRRRLGRRLPRGLHDRRRQTRTARRILGSKRRDPEKPPGLRRQRRRRHLHHHPEHLPRRGAPGPLRARLLDLPARRLLREEESAGYQFPQRRRPSFESPIPPGTVARKNAARSPSTRRSRSTPARPDRLARRGRRSTVDVPQRQNARNGKQDSSHRADRHGSTLPAGMGLNPSAANGLQACTDAQFGKGTRQPGRLPGRLEDRHGRRSTSPPLPEGSLTGNVYVGQQLSRDPTSGNEYRIFVDAESARYGISVRLIGNVSADPQTGQLTDDLRRQPAGPVQLLPAQLRRRADGAADQPADLRPEHDDDADDRLVGQRRRRRPGNGFTLTTAPGGGACAKTLAERPFAPELRAPSRTAPRPAPSRPFAIDIARSDGQQELKGVDVTLPPGMTAQAGRHPLLPGGGDSPPRRPAAARAEAANSSCPATSLVGSAAVSAGTGPSPLHIDGKVFLAGPYHGAPLSLAVVTPATAGPFDLGTVVVRVALFVDPETAQIHAVSDPIPARLRRRPARHPLGRRQHRPQEVHPQPDQLLAVRDRRRAARRRRRPDQPGRLQLLPGLAPRSRSATARALGLQAEAVTCGCSAARDRGQAPEAARGPRRPRRRRQHRPRRGHPAARRCSSTRPASARSAPGSSSPPTTARRTRSTATRGRTRRCSTDRSKARSTCAPPNNELPDLVAAPPRPGRRRPRRPHRQRQGRHPHHLRPRPRRAGLEVRRDPAGRQARPAGHLAQPLPRQGQSDRPGSKARTARKPTSGRSCGPPAARRRSTEKGIEPEQSASDQTARSSNLSQSALDSRATPANVWESLGEVLERHAGAAFRSTGY